MLAGDRIGAYTLVEPLGRGGMGSVWRARTADREVALKLLHRADPRLVEAIGHEIAVLSRLSHPRVAAIVDHGTADGWPWYAMTLIEGRCLEVRRRTRAAQTWFEGDEGDEGAGDRERDPRDTGKLLSGIAQLCDTLAWLHGQGVVHRDVKPDNAIVRRDGEVVLVDFGLAHRQAGRDALGPGVASGTVAFAAPEQLRGEAVDGRADLYAIGCMLVEGLTGAPLFEGTPAMLLEAQLSSVPRPRWDRCPHVHPDLVALVGALLEKDPTDRPAFADEVRDRLEQVIGAPVSRGPRPRPAWCRSRLHGRDEALREVDAAIARATAERRPSVAVVRGGPGSGRTRLLADAIGAARVRGMVVLTADTAAADGTPLSGLGPVRDRLAPPGGPTPASPDDARRMKVATALGALRLLAATRPVLLALDDLDAADRGTLDLVGELADDVRGDAAIAVLASVGTDEAPPGVRSLEPRAQVRWVTLGPLPPDAILRSTDDRLGGRAPDGLGAWVEARAQGSPRWATEALRIAMARGALVRSDGRWSFTAIEDERSLTVQRLERLSDRARRAVLAIDLLGTQSRPDRVAAVAGLADDEVWDALGELAREELVEDAAIVPLRLTVPGLGAAVRAEVDAGPWELRAAEVLDPVAPSLAARRWLAGGDVDRARAALSRAADRAMADSPDDGLAHLRAWLALGGTPGERLPIHVRTLEAAYQAGRWTEFDARADALDAELADHPSPEAAFQLLVRRADLAVRRGLFADGLRWAQRALDAAGATADPVVARLEATLQLARSLGQAGDPDRGDALFREILADPRLEGERRIRALSGHGVLLAVLGRDDEARPLWDALLALPDATWSQTVSGLTNLGKSEWRAGRHESALAHFERARTLARERGALAIEATLAGNVGAVMDTLGRDDAEVLLERAVELNQVLGAELGLRTAVGNLAVFHLNRGRLEEAAGGFARAADLAHRHRDIRHAAVWTRWTATVALFLGRTEEARVAAETGRALAVESGFAEAIAAATALLGHIALAAGEDAAGWWERARAAGPNEAADTLRTAIDAVGRGERVVGGFALDELPPRLAARLRGGAS